MGSMQASPRDLDRSPLPRTSDLRARYVSTVTRLRQLASSTKGLGKVRHLDVADLWAQDKVRTGVVEIVKVQGADKPADVMTKYTDRPILINNLAKMNMHALPGRAACAPAYADCQ